MRLLMKTGFRLIEASPMMWVSLFHDTAQTQRLYTDGRPFSYFLPEGGLERPKRECWEGMKRKPLGCCPGHLDTQCYAMELAQMGTRWESMNERGQGANPHFLSTG